MAYNEGVGLTYTVQDEKTKKSSFTVNFPNTSDVPLVGSYDAYVVANTPADGFASNTAVLLKPLLAGAIVGASLGIRVSLTGATLKGAPASYTDVEEGALFSWRSAVGAPTRFRIPTFLETFGFNTGTAVDTQDPTVDAFVQRIIQGDTQGATTVRWADSRGNNVASLISAVEKFKRSRKRR